MTFQLPPEDAARFQENLAESDVYDREFAWQLFRMATSAENWGEVYAKRRTANPPPLYLSLSLQLRKDEHSRRIVRNYLAHMEKKQ